MTGSATTGKLLSLTHYWAEKETISIKKNLHVINLGRHWTHAMVKKVNDASPHGITMISFISPSRLYRPAQQSLDDSSKCINTDPEWRLMFGKSKKVISGHVIGDIWPGIVIPFHTFMPKFGIRDMKDFPPCPACPNTPLGLLPIKKVVGVQRSCLFNQSTSNKDRAA